MFPGLLSDLLGVCLLVPSLRAALARWLLPRGPEGLPPWGGSPWSSEDPAPPPEASRRGPEAGSGGPRRPTGPVRDAEFEMLQEDTDEERDD